MNDQVILNVVLEALPGHEEELADRLQALVAPSQSEAGCLDYRLHRDPERAGTFLFYERFASQAALDTHLETAHFKNFTQNRAAANPDPVGKVTVTRWHLVA